ncbi:hypothetical protein N7466_001953 [Penicillium verhagenii]|uniref:uncharacterized protein n=1 Tax=Penicillium verhagenii TaxID=1562060 RepID=UPI0025455203|nr:uncharacterized protein N7466_001953 [Penicillium verhagenii]KAJ5938819.1 hypothetical protein N7466_001953 [Penicillium verhagenii]
MASEQRNVYCTLLLSDNYLPGAMVLAHSLRDNGTTAKLVALFTPNTLRSETVNELRTVYDELIPVNSIVNGTPANLWLMDRPDLIATFTKIELWRLTQYKRIVYIDCDVIALRAPDELFSLDVNFAAAPDVGWPDCFNSGLMVLRPNMQDYYTLKALAERGISFDGADQGLLNMHFQDWHKLSFTYNCTPSANYQYIPAYKHFQSTISLIHFIGSQKPWNLPRQVVPLESPYNQLLNKWWSVYDRHYHAPFVSYSQQEIVLPAAHPTDRPESLQSLPESSLGHQHFHHAEDQSVSDHHEEGHSSEYVPALVSLESREAHYVPPQHDHHAVDRDTFSSHIPVLSAVPQYVRGEEQYSTFIPPVHYAPAPVIHEHHVSHEAQPEGQYMHYGHDNQHHHQQDQHHGHHHLHQQQQHDHQHQQQQQQHDHQQQHPHHNHQHHQQSDQTEAHIHHPQPVAPPPAVEHWHRAPSPEPEVTHFQAPKAEWDASREPPPLNTRPEGISLEQKTYTMSEDTALFQPPPSYPEAPKNMYYQVPESKPEPERVTKIFPWENNAPRPTRVFTEEAAVVPRTPSPEIPMLPQQVDSLPIESPQAEPQIFPIQAPYEPSAETYEQYSRLNAWDEDPEIQRYMGSLQQYRRGKTQVISGSVQASSSHSRSTSLSTSNFSSSSTATTTGTSAGHRLSMKLTDFPTEIERPSLPVTPAPIHRVRGLQSDDNDASTLPTAEGVPSQEDWVGVTVDAFSHLLRATYLLWRSTESPDAARRAPTSTIRSPGGSGSLV